MGSKWAAHLRGNREEPRRILPFPIAADMFAHGVRWVLISLAGVNVATGALIACILVSVMVTPVVDRLHPAVRYARLFHRRLDDSGLLSFPSSKCDRRTRLDGPRAPATLLTNIGANGVTALLVILAMTFGLILPRVPAS
jgi:hypothetical protein